MVVDLLERGYLLRMCPRFAFQRSLKSQLRIYASEDMCHIGRCTLKPMAGYRGFTLIELVMVLIIVGVLAVFIAPRINPGGFDARGLHDGTTALLRYAQKTAIAQRRTVCVVFGANRATLTMAAAAATPGCVPAAALTGPGGEVPATVVGRGTAAYTPIPAGFNFNGLGQPVNNAGVALPTQIITVVNGPGNITVETVTGFVQ
jgi:MSHA pilin protein MshC